MVSRYAERHLRREDSNVRVEAQKMMEIWIGSWVKNDLAPSQTNASTFKLSNDDLRSH